MVGQTDMSDMFYDYIIYILSFSSMQHFANFAFLKERVQDTVTGRQTVQRLKKTHEKTHTKYWCGRQTSKNLRREIFLRTQSCANNWWTPPPSLPPSPATLRAPLFVGMFSSHWSYQSMLKLQRQFGNFRGHAKPWWGCPQWQVVTVNRYSLRTLKNDSLPFIGASGLTGSTCDSWFSP